MRPMEIEMKVTVEISIEAIEALLALLADTKQTPDLDQAMSDLRAAHEAILEEYWDAQGY